MDSYILVYGLPDKSDSPYIEYCTTAGRTTRIHMDPMSPANVVVTLPSKSGTLATMADVPSPTSDVVCHAVSTSGYIKSPVVSVASDGANGVTSITRPANDSNWMLTLPNKSGTIALLDDIKGGGGGAVVAVVGGTGIKVTGTTENPVINIDTEVVATIGHNHSVADVTGLATTLAGKADAAHAHSISDVTGLQTALNAKAASVHSHNTSDVVGLGSMATVNTPASDGKTYGMKDGQWAVATGVPDQTGNAGKFLITDGSNTQWFDIDNLGQDVVFLADSFNTLTWDKVSPYQWSVVVDATLPHSAPNSVRMEYARANYPGSSANINKTVSNLDPTLPKYTLSFWVYQDKAPLYAYYPSVLIDTTRIWSGTTIELNKWVYIELDVSAALASKTSAKITLEAFTVAASSWVAGARIFYDDVKLIGTVPSPIAVPPQAGHSGEILTTNGTHASWTKVTPVSQYDYSLSIDESFGNLAKWTQKSGTWTAAGGICSIVVAPASSNYIQYNTSIDCSVWFAVEADFKITSAGSWGGAGIAITDSDIAAPYKLAFALTNHASVGTGIFGIVNAGASWIYTSTNKYWSNDTWVRMRVVVGMDRVVYVYINNVLVERVPVTSSDFKIPLTPFVSIYAGDCTLNIKNLKVWDLSYKTVPRTVVRVSDVDGLPEGLSYSTSETLTGGTWVDGKPVYRKVIDTGALPGNAIKSVASGITSLGWLISIQGAATSATDSVPIPYCDPTDVQNNIQLGFKRTDGTISIRTGTTWWVDGGFTKSQVIMEYTKA